MNRFHLNTGNLALCILELLIGILLCINPMGFTTGIIIVVGILLSMAGAADLLSYFRSDPQQAAQQDCFA